MPEQLGAARWRSRAAESRLLSEMVDDEDAKFRMLRIASDYDKLAEWAERRAAMAARERP